ncbi:putative polyketide synthase [Trichoderma barbatum]
MASSSVSGVVFSPQTRAPQRSYLDYIRTALKGSAVYIPLYEAVSALSATWHDLANQQPKIDSLEHGLTNARHLSTWIETGETSGLENSMSGIVTLPLLTVIHTVQYIQYLRLAGITHSEFLKTLCTSGVQGFCAGLMTAMVVASSKDETELINNAAKAVRISLGIGAFGEIGSDATMSTSTTMVVRLRSGSEGEQIVREFPESYVSAISDPKTISLIAPASQIAAIQAYIEKLGLSFKMVHMRSNIHNPNNRALADELLSFCLAHSELQLPDSDSLQVRVRSNRTGQVLSECSLTAEIINTILASCCNWDVVMNNLAQELRQSGIKSHHLAMIGLGDCIPLAPFQKNMLDITKLDVMSLTYDSKRFTNSSGVSSLDLFPPHSIAVVGAGCRLPGANTLEELWELISRGESRLESLREDRFKLEESFRGSQDRDWITKRKWFGNFIDGVDEFDHGFFGISQKEAAYMDPQQRLLLTCAYEAMDASGYLHKHKRENGDPIGCFIGASYTEYNENVSAYAPSAFAATGTIRAFLSGKISYHFGWTGPSEVIDTACSASLVAVHHACRAIQAGDCSMALAGGVNLITGVHNYIDLGRAGFLSKTGQCKPFDATADGYCRADGVGLVLLKPLKQAVADGNHILGVIPATATNQGGLSNGITVPHGVAQKALYSQIVKSAGIEPEQVTYVESHGTGTQVGDPIEIASIREVFGGPSRRSAVHIGSLKGNVGHSETAAGVASLLKVLSMFAHQGIPPQAGFKTLNPKIPALAPDNLKIATELIPWETKGRIACVNSYGASGSNAALICAEWMAESEKSKPNSSSYPIFLSANTQANLNSYANRLISYIQGAAKDLDIGSVSYTLSQRRKHHRFRWSTTAKNLSDLELQLKSGFESNAVELPKTRKPVVLAFSGQSKTKIGLDLGLCSIYPQFQTYLQNCNSILKTLGYSDIMSALSQVETITDVVALHAGTFAVQYACAKCWLDGGLQVDAVIGHSLGELTALAVSGILSLEDALKLVATRATLIEAKWGSDTGTMLAVYSDLGTVQRIMTSSEIELMEDNVEIACYNSSTAHILVGKHSSIVRVEKLIDSDPQFRGARYQRLDVSHGFHSKLTEPLLPDLMEFATTLTFNEPSIPLETCTEEPATKITPTYITKHSRHAVYFTHAVQRLEKRLGPCVWLEAGWHTPIISMTKKALATPEVHSFQSLNGSAAAVTNVTTSLWKQGISTSWWGFLSPTESKLGHIWLPPLTFQGSRHWIDHVDRTIEAQQSHASTYLVKDSISPQPTQLVNFLSTTGRDYVFKLFTQSEKYKNMVTGHAVRQRPLCPASMYMEAAVMCAQQRGFDFDGQALRFRKIGFHSGLGCDDNRDVRVTLAEPSGATAWRFSVQSLKKDDSRATKTKHADGEFEASTKMPDFRIYEALILERMEGLLKDRSAEHLMKRTAYALFSRVVEYADLLRGISSITLAPRQAVAEIEVPESTIKNRESTVDRFMDAISLDTFIQVLGLLINMSGNTVGDEIFVATSIENMTILPCDFMSQRRWSVYAMFGMDGDRRAVGDVFVFSGDGKLAVFGSGISFTKIQASILEGLLDGNSPRMSVSKAHAQDRTVLPNRTPVDSANEPIKTQTLCQPAVNPNSSPDESQASGHKFEDVKILIASYIGLSASDIREEESFSSLGLDSLSAVELSDELRVKFSIDVSPSDILTIQVSDLRTHFPSTTNESNSMTNSSGIRADNVPTSINETAVLTNGLTNGHVNGHVSGYVNGYANGYSNGNKANDINGYLGSKPKVRQYTRHRVETVTYKEVAGVEIPADIFIPLEPPSGAMPIALMIHGGGHLTLSRKAVRPPQTSFLLANGILPISLDYRLCPQVNIIDGSMADVRDAYAWAIKDVPLLMQEKDIKVDPSKIVVVGWSTGGHLAMTTAWTAPAAGLPPPLAILAFYCPTHYDPSDDSLRMGKEYQPRSMSMNEIRKALGPQTVTSHAFSSTDTSGLGWVKPGDPRSELVLALVKEKNGMALLLDGIPPDGDTLEAPDSDRVAAISPLAQVQKGNYHTPTFVIIGDEDEIVPFHTSVNFVNALNKHGVKNGFISVPGERHIYDLTLTPGMEKWEEWVAPGYRFLFDVLGIISTRCNVS